MRGGTIEIPSNPSGQGDPTSSSKDDRSLDLPSSDQTIFDQDNARLKAHGYHLRMGCVSGLVATHKNPIRFQTESWPHDPK